MKDAILFFCTGEMFWEFGRFAPYFLWKRKKQYKNKNIDFIVLTKPENFDIYGQNANILVPLRLKDQNKYKPNCFRLDNMTIEEYKNIISIFKSQFKNRYNILEVVYPDISKNQYSNKNQFPRDKTNYDYKPRIANKELLNKYIDNDKPIIILAPRYREGFKRNWPYWNELYDMIYDNTQLINSYNFVLCGKKPDYISDLKNRFLDINNFEQNINTSLIGLTMECLKRSILTIGSQSAIPNISLLFGVKTIEWGHQKHLHTVTYNIKKTKVTFFEDAKYKISPDTIYKEILNNIK